MSQETKTIISVIIPTLNEAENIRDLIQYIQKNNGDDLIEVIVADANSKDKTAAIAHKEGAKIIITKQASRAHQMNEGAKMATGKILYFVHADVKPPKSFLQDIIQYTNRGYLLGCYRFKFDSKHPLLIVNSFFTRFKFLWCRGGDQTFFIKKELFDKCGGFNEAYIVMEDFELIRRLWKDYNFVVMPKSTLVSARKYIHNSYWKVNIANLKIFRLFMKGEDPEVLKDKYYELIKHPKDI